MPCRYDDLYFTNVRHGVETNAPARQHAPGRCFFEAPYERPIYHIDTLVLQAERGGKVGFVDFQTGRELVPPRYDQVIFSSRNGMACVVRQGRAYIIDRRGRELRAAQPFNAFNNGGVARDWQWGAGHRTYLLLSSNSPPNMWLVPDTAWLVTNRRGRTIVPPQPMSRLPLFVTNAGRVAVQTATGCGLLGQGGRVVLAPRYQILAQYGRLLGGFTPEDSTNRLTLFDARGHRLRVLPGVRHVALLTVSGLLYVTQQLPHRRWQTLLLNQAGQVQVVLPGCHNINELPNNVALRQRRYLLQIYPEMDPFTNEEMPGSPACGYMSTNGRRFWEE